MTTEEVREEQEKAVRLEMELEVNDLKSIMGTKVGRRFVNRIMEESGPFRSAFTSDSQRVTDYRLGQGSIGLRLMDLIYRYCRNLEDLMIAENSKRNQDGRSS